MYGSNADQQYLAGGVTHSGWLPVSGQTGECSVYLSTGCQLRSIREVTRLECSSPCEVAMAGRTDLGPGFSLKGPGGSSATLLAEAVLDDGSRVSTKVTLEFVKVEQVAIQCVDGVCGGPLSRLVGNSERWVPRARGTSIEGASVDVQVPSIDVVSDGGVKATHLGSWVAVNAVAPGKGFVSFEAAGASRTVLLDVAPLSDVTLLRFVGTSEPHDAPSDLTQSPFNAGAVSTELSCGSSVRLGLEATLVDAGIAVAKVSYVSVPQGLYSFTSGPDYNEGRWLWVVPKHPGAFELRAQVGDAGTSLTLNVTGTEDGGCR